MQTLGFEWRMIRKHKVYWLFCLFFVASVCMSLRPWELGKNMAPMDQEHFWVRQIIVDSQKNVLRNSSFDDTLIDYKLEKTYLDVSLNKNTELYKDKDGLNTILEERHRVQQEIEQAENARRIPVSPDQRKQLERIAAICAEQLENGTYSVGQLARMDTDLFQKLSLSTDMQEIEELKSEADQVIGGNSYYGNQAYRGYTYSQLYYVKMSYNWDFQRIYRPSRAFKELDQTEALQRYQDLVSKYSYDQLFTGFVMDRIGMCYGACMIAVLLWIFYELVTVNLQDILYMKMQSDVAYFFQKLGSMLFAAILPGLLCVTLVNGILSARAKMFGYTMDFLELYQVFFLWIIPEILLFLSVGMLLILYTEQPFPPFVLQGLCFMISFLIPFGIKGVFPVLRFDYIGQPELLETFRWNIWENRLGYVIVSIVCMMLVLRKYRKKRGGEEQERKNRRKEWRKQKYKNTILYRKLNQLREERNARELDMDRSVFTYQMRLGYGKSFLYTFCVIAVAFGLWSQMNGHELQGNMLSLFQWSSVVMPAAMLILCSYVDFVENKVECRDIVWIKDRIGVQWIRLLMNAAGIFLLCLCFVSLVGKLPGKEIAVVTAMCYGTSMIQWIGSRTKIGIGGGCVLGLLSVFLYGFVAL